MGESRLRRAARTLSDKWSLLAAVTGGGVAWAVGLGLAAGGVVSIGMLGVAAVAGAMIAGDDPPAAAPEPELIPGTVQYRSVRALESYLADLTKLQGGPAIPLLAAQAGDAVLAATSARTVAVQVAGSVDQLDLALVRAIEVKGQMTATTAVAALVDRMQARRAELLAQLGRGVDGVGEVYARLLELSTTAGVLGDPTLAAPDPVAEVNGSLVAIRQAFADLESAAHRVTDRLSVPDDRQQPPSF